MPRVRKGAARHRKHKRVLKEVRGHRGAASDHYRVARQAATRAGQFAYRDRRNRKRDMRRLWIARISAACRQRDLRYSQLIAALKAADIALNRKMLSEIAVSDPEMFDRIVEAAMKAA